MMTKSVSTKKVHTDSILLQPIRIISSMMTKNKAWCKNLINFIKILKWENVKREVPYQ